MKAAPNIFDRSSSPLPERLTTALAKVGLALKSQAWQGASARGLTPTQGQVLALLDAREGAPVRLSDVAAGLGVTPPTASDAVRSLVEKGLVLREQAKDDARAISLKLTAEGRREARGAAAWPDFLLAAVETLSEEEQETFLVAIMKMIRTLQERGQIPISKMCVTCRYFRPHRHKDPKKPHHCALVDAPFGPRHLRLECKEHELASPEERETTWIRFLGRRPPTPDVR